MDSTIGQAIQRWHLDSLTLLLCSFNLRRKLSATVLSRLAVSVMCEIDNRNHNSNIRQNQGDLFMIHIGGIYYRILLAKYFSPSRAYEIHFPKRTSLNLIFLIYQ